MSLPRLLPVFVLLLASTPVAHSAQYVTQTRYGLSESEFRAANAELLGKGMRLVDLTVAEVKGKPVIGAIWGGADNAAPATPERVRQLQSLVHLRLSLQEIEATTKRREKEGSEIEVVDAYVSDGKPLYAAVYAPPKELPVAKVGLFLDVEQLSQLRDEALDSGFDLQHLEIEATPTSYVHFASFVEGDELEMRSNVADTRVQFGAKRASLEQQGLVPYTISMFRRADGAAGYSGLFVEGQGLDLLLGLPLADFRAKIEPVLAQGGRVYDIDSFASGDELQYSAVYLPGAGSR